MSIIEIITRAINKGFAVDLSTYKNGFKSVTINEDGNGKGCVFITEYAFGVRVHTVRILEHNGKKKSITTAIIKKLLK